MELADESEKLVRRLKALPQIAIEGLRMKGSALYTLDFILLGAVNRTKDVGRGLQAMVETKNMLGARAMLRMQLDTVSRLMGYTYVEDPNEVASKVMEGQPLHRFKARNGKPLRDGYLIDCLADTHPWAREVYERTSGEVHFSERQVYASVHSLDRDEEGSATVTFRIGDEDDQYPDWSWAEVIACFLALLDTFEDMLLQYGQHKGSQQVAPADPPSEGG